MALFSSVSFAILLQIKKFFNFAISSQWFFVEGVFTKRRQQHWRSSYSRALKDWIIESNWKGNNLSLPVELIIMELDILI